MNVFQNYQMKSMYKQKIRRPLKKLFLTMLLGFLELGLILTVLAHSYDSDVEFNSFQTGTIFLPLVSSNRPCDIGGKATLHDQPVNGLVFRLSYQFFDSLPPPPITATTNEKGDFCFIDVPVLSSCRGMHYNLSAQLTPQRNDSVRSWFVFGLDRCGESQVYRDFHAELADFVAITPINEVTVSLPITFNWERPVEKESYKLYWQQPSCNYPPIVWQGEATTAVISQTLPSCITYGEPISWYISGSSEYGTVYSQYHTFLLEPSE